MIGKRVQRGALAGGRGDEWERGSIVPLATVAALVLFAVLAFAVDQGLAYAAKARQENALDAARASCMDASFALAAKNADNPARLIAERAAHSVRTQGCEGHLTVWFYEVPQNLLPATERLWAIGMQVEEEVPTVFARGWGVTNLPVASYRVVTAVPYAEAQVWRPDGRTCGKFDLAAGASPPSTTFVSLSSLEEYPAEIRDQVRAAISAKASDGKEGSK